MKISLTIVLAIFITYSGFSQKFRSVLHATPGTDNGLEFFEIEGTPNMSLNNLYFLEVSGADGSAGVITNVKNLSPYSLGSNGILLWRDAATVIAPGPNPATRVVVEDFSPDLYNGTNTFLIVKNFTGHVGTDIDADDDGIPNASFLPWTEVIAALSVKEKADSYKYYAVELCGDVIINPVGKHFVFYENYQWNYTNITGDLTGMTVADGQHAGRIIVPGNSYSVLPVELSYFRVNKSNAVALLEWQTASERNNAGFTVERSSDGKSFVQIGEATGKGDSDEAVNYTFTDNNPANGINYYRLKQQDFDGSVSYSPVRSISIVRNSTAYLYPAVSSGVVVVSFPEKLKDDTRIEVVEFSTGRVVNTQHLTANTERHNINTSKLNAGTYLVIVYDGTYPTRLKFVVNR